MITVPIAEFATHSWLSASLHCCSLVRLQLAKSRANTTASCSVQLRTLHCRGLRRISRMHFFVIFSLTKILPCHQLLSEPLWLGESMSITETKLTYVNLSILLPSIGEILKFPTVCVGAATKMCLAHLLATKLVQRIPQWKFNGTKEMSFQSCFCQNRRCFSNSLTATGLL